MDVVAKCGIAVGIIVILFLVALLCGSGIMAPGTAGVKVFLGSVDTTPVMEGFYTRLPFVTTVKTMNTQQVTKPVTMECYSSDLQTVTVLVAVYYRIPPKSVPTLYQQYSGDPYTTLVEPRILEALKKEMSRYTAEEIVKNRDKIKSDTFPQIVQSMRNLIEITDVAITNIDLQPDLEKAIEQKQIKQQEALATAYLLQKAQKEAEIAVTAAKGEAESLKLRADAVRDVPNVMLLDAIKKWDGKTPSYVGMGNGISAILPQTK